MHYNGLSDKEVLESRQKHGSNVIPDSEPTTFWAEFKETFGDPMIRILLAIAALMIVMCIFGYADIYEPIGTIVAILIVAFVSAKTGVASDTKYRQLKDSTKKDQCKVYRNGVITVIDMDDAVVGDKVLLHWAHYYMHRNSGSFPERPVISVEPAALSGGKTGE